MEPLSHRFFRPFLLPEHAPRDTLAAALVYCLSHSDFLCYTCYMLALIAFVLRLRDGYYKY